VTLEQKLKNQLTWLKSLETSGNFSGDFESVRLGIIEDRKYFQHERLIHLLVTLGIAVILMFVFCLFVTQLNRLYGILFLILLVLESAYLVHYYRLENGVQQLWEIEQRIFETSNQISRLAEKSSGN